MTMKRILHCTLMFMVLVTSGCGLFPGSEEPGAQQNTDSENSRPIPWANISGQLQNLISRINSQEDPQLKVSDIANEVGKMSVPFGRNKAALEDKCSQCTPEVLTQAEDARSSLEKITSKLDSAKADPVLKPNDKNEIVSLLEKAQASLDKANELSKPPDSPTILQRLKLPGLILGAMLGVFSLASALSYLWKRSWKTVEFNVGQVLQSHLAATREAQPDYAPKLSSLSSTQTEMSSRLNDLDSEVRSLARLVRESLATRRSDHNPSYSGLNYHSQVESVSPKDEPEFPVSAVDYLGKMNRFANVVRPDFQNGILVNAPDGDGELVLIRDSRDDTQPLFVVPRATQFQTKQDFYTYYQKYYDCVRPSAGDVWIIGPAVVDKVAGGWQLREKGMLEIR